MGSLHVVHGGLHTTVQDRGRWGFQSLGVPVAGAMDQAAHRLANALAGNDPSAATLEVTLSGPELVFDDERRVAVTGGEFELMLDESPVPMHACLFARAGARLRFGARRRGARAYVGVAGGVDVAPVLGSRATDVGSGMGGLNGRALTAGDRLPLGSSRGSGRQDCPALTSEEVAALIRLPPDEGRLRVVPGPEQDRFEPAAPGVLQSATYVVGPDSNRMGYRLEGPVLVHRSGADVLSMATVAGAIQVPASGRPVLLMADRQTTGGYARIASVIAADLDAAGQLAPGDRVRFEPCTLRDALSALVARERALMSVEARVAP